MVFYNSFNLLKSVALVTILVVSPLVVHSQDEGRACNHFGYWGICTKMQKCQPIVDQALRGQPPKKLCNWGTSLDPIVCCPTSDTTPTPPKNNNNNPFLKTERKAEKMCKEYVKYVYETVASPVVLSSQTVYLNVTTCAKDVIKLIVGGRKAEPREFPYMAAIGFSRNPNGEMSWDCGGTLISETYVMTAAHCTYSQSRGPAQRVRVGDLNLLNSEDDAQPQEVRIVEKIQHPQYKPPAKYNDIALLRLEKPIKLNKYARPACLFTGSTLPNNESPVAAGWGTVSWTSEKGSSDLLKVVLPLVSEQKCQQAYDTNNKLPTGLDFKTQICAGVTGKDTCQGDSGGPLMITSSQYCMHDVIGITSFGKLCGSSSPGIYTRVSAYVPWIESIVWPN